MGILTWIFVDGHFSRWLNFTPTPLMVVIIALVVAVGFGLATDYEVFLVSRMVEARARGMSTAEAIRIGTATTGRLITAAALVLAVVAGSFVFSDLVLMKYLAFGLMAALLLDATVVRMFLVPSVMKLLGDDCWWAPRWARRLQNRIGLGEIDLPDERKRPVLAGVPRGLRSDGRPGRRDTAPTARPHTPRAAAPLPPLEAPRPASRPATPPAPDGPTPSGAKTAQIPTRPGSRPSRRRRVSQRPAATGAPVDGAATPPRPGLRRRHPAPETGPETSADTAARAVGRTDPGHADSGQPGRRPRRPHRGTPVMRPEGPEGADSDAATEKMNARGLVENGSDKGPPKQALKRL